MDLRVTRECPQCGGTIALSEAERLLACPFCGVRHLLVDSGLPRYLLPPAPSIRPQQELLWAPYLRCKASIFSVSLNDIRHVVVDTTLPGCALPGLPPSLGLRPQAMTLSSLPPRFSGRLLPLTLDPGQALNKAVQLGSPDGGELGATLAASILQQHGRAPRATGQQRDLLHQCVLGELLSVLYLPLEQRDGRVFDAVRQTDLPLAAAASRELADAVMALETWQPRFLPLLCPRCGGTLDGCARSVILTCTSCATAWAMGQTGLTPLAVQEIPGGNPAGPHIPFWRFLARVSQPDIDSFADFLVSTNQPRVPRPEWRQRPFALWIPACKMRPQTFLLACRQATLNQYRLEPQTGSIPAAAHPVTLTSAQAGQALQLTLAACAVNRKAIRPQLPATRFILSGTELVYLPCVDQGQELLQPQTGLALGKNVLQLGEKL